MQAHTALPLYSDTVCNGAIVTLSIDHQGLIRVGETVRLECVHTGLEAITWVINEYYYTSTNLPEKHSLDSNNNGVLIITSVDLMMNGSSYQCFVQSTFSNIVHLYMESGKILVNFICYKCVQDSPL